MERKKKLLGGDNDLSTEEARREFGMSIEELKMLMQRRGHQGSQELNETYGGINGLEKKLKTNLTTGLSGDENDLSTRKDAFGRNEIPPNPPKSFFYLMLNALQNVGIIKILVFAIILFVLSFYSQNGETFEDEASPKEGNVELIEGIAMIIVVLVVVLLTVFNDWTKERQFRDVQSKLELNQKFNVIRQNTLQQIPIKDIVVGDICQMKSGDLLPADDILIQSNHLKIDESSLTGDRHNQRYGISF